MRLLLAAINCAKNDLAANLAVHLDLLRRGRDADCDLVVFPEMSLSGSVDPDAHPERLLALDANPVAVLVEASESIGIGAVFGVAEPGPYITQVFVDRGVMSGIYRKAASGRG